MHVAIFSRENLPVTSNKNKNIEFKQHTGVIPAQKDMNLQSLTNNPRMYPKKGISNYLHKPGHELGHIWYKRGFGK